MDTTQNNTFLPVTRDEMLSRGWDAPDFVYVNGDAYVDHPSFGAAIISRVLESAGYRVAMLAQPDFHSTEDFCRFGRPRLGFLVSAGNIDSMVAHYSVAKKRRGYDYYSPGGKTGLRPDRACIVYTNRIREAYGDVPVILGGLEASLRRFAHYDFWDDRVRTSVLIDSGADMLTYGMGENILLRIAELLDRGVPIHKIRDVRGTVWVGGLEDKIHYPLAATYEFSKLVKDKKYYAEAFATQYKNQDAIYGKAIAEKYGKKLLVANPPMPPLEREELDRVYDLPYVRDYHPMYKKMGGVPAIEEVKFSVTHNRGCFGACNFCALAFHQGRAVRSRSIESCVRETEKITQLEGFKGYIHDVGGPTANFRGPACKKQLTHGVCAEKRCLAPTPCKQLIVDHSEYIELIRRIEAVPKVKRVFIRSGIRFDYVMADESDAFFKKLVRDNVSGQLKVAPEHCSANVLHCMGKPEFGVFNRFRAKYFKLSAAAGKEQYLVPYLMSSHPGSTLDDAIELAYQLKQDRIAPEQVQDFYPTPGTASTVMYYTGHDPFTGKAVYVADEKEKRLQRALLQPTKPENAYLVREALRRAGREDLIGFDKDCIIRPDKNDTRYQRKDGGYGNNKGSKNAKPQGRGGRNDSKGGRGANDRNAKNDRNKSNGRNDTKNGRNASTGRNAQNSRNAKPQRSSQGNKNQKHKR